MVSIKLNGTEQNINENSSVLAAIEAFSIAQNGIAVAVNQQIITKTNWTSTVLKENDEILIIKATQGG